MTSFIDKLQRLFYYFVNKISY